MGWSCIKRILNPSGTFFWSYLLIDCDTGTETVAFMQPGLDVGDCENPSVPNCIQDPPSASVLPEGKTRRVVVITDNMSDVNVAMAKEFARIYASLDDSVQFDE